MEMRIGDTAFGIRSMNGKIADHAPADELLLQEPSRQVDVFFQGQFVLQSNIIAVSQLRFWMFLCFLHSVPKRFPISERSGNMGRQKNLFVYNSLLSRVVRIFIIITAVQAFPCPVCSGSNYGLSGRAFDDPGVKMVQSDQPSSPLTCEGWTF